MKIPQNVIFNNPESQSNHLLEYLTDLNSNFSKGASSLQRINDQFELSIYSLEKKLKLLKQINEKYEQCCSIKSW